MYGMHAATVRGGVSPTLTGDHQNRVTDYTAVVCAGFKAGQSMAGSIGWQEGCAATLSAKCSGTEPTVCVAFDQQRIGQYGTGGGRKHADGKRL